MQNKSLKKNYKLFDKLKAQGTDKDLAFFQSLYSRLKKVIVLSYPSRK